MSFLKKIVGNKETILWTEKSFEDFFKTYYSSLCKLIFRILKDKDQTEDLVQDVFIKLWEKRNEISIDTSPRSYLYRSAINSAYTFLEKNKRYPKLSIDDSEEVVTVTTGNGEQLEAQDLEQKIEILLASLPEACREVFILSRFESMSYKEIAEALGISVKTVENQMGKALRVFREGLQRG